MSWSVGAIGKPAAVAAKMETDFANFRCTEPEESVRQAALVTILAAVNAQSPESVVQVAASGSQSTYWDKDGNVTGFQNSLEIKIQPIYGFVE